MGCCVRAPAAEHLPKRYGKAKNAAPPLQPPCHAGAWELAFAALTAGRDNKHLMLGSGSSLPQAKPATSRKLQHCSMGAGGPRSPTKPMTGMPYAQ